MARARKIKLAITHSTLGCGAVLYRVQTDTGPALRVQFADRTRTLLVEGAAWATGVNAAEIFDAAPDPPKPKEPPIKVVKVRTLNTASQLEDERSEMAEAETE